MAICIYIYVLMDSNEATINNTNDLQTVSIWTVIDILHWLLAAI